MTENTRQSRVMEIEAALLAGERVECPACGADIARTGLRISGHPVQVPGEWRTMPGVEPPGESNQRPFGGTGLCGCGSGKLEIACKACAAIESYTAHEAMSDQDEGVMLNRILRALDGHHYIINGRVGRVKASQPPSSP